MTTAIFHRATTADGQRLEYRTSPLAVVVKAIHSWLYLPASLRRWAFRRGVQRRVDGGPWLTIGGAP